jgi:hypothetical protein
MIRMFLGTFMLIVFGLSCDNNFTQDPSSSVDDWNTIRSDWTDSNTYTEDSQEANAAYDTFQGVSEDNSVYSVDHFQILLQSVEENVSGTQTWTYAITKIADGSQFKDLSHFALFFGNCDDSNVVDMGGGSYGPDPSATECAGTDDGLKWDRSVSAGETVYYSFTVDQVYGMGEATGLVKYGTSCNTVTLPGPDCDSPVVVETPVDPDPDDGTDGDPTATDNCPEWIDTLALTATVEYKNFHGYNNLNFPVYYVGETMHADLAICNNTPYTATGLTVTTIVESYPNGGLACGEPVQDWTGVTIGAYDCLTLDHSFLLARSCAWGNYESHLMVTRDADGTCPVSALIMANGIVGYFDP